MRSSHGGEGLVDTAVIYLFHAEAVRKRQLGPRGITANVIAPGLVTETEFFGDSMTAERRNRLVAATMTKRAGRPDDIAAAVGSLASGRAGHITGQVLHVDGGATHSQ